MPASEIGTELLARLDAVPALASRTDVSDLSGGLTNRNLKVTTPDGVYVARLSSPESALLAIDRDNEQANSVAAAASGAAPAVIEPAERWRSPPKRHIPRKAENGVPRIEAKKLIPGEPV